MTIIFVQKTCNFPYKFLPHFKERKHYLIVAFGLRFSPASLAFPIKQKHINSSLCAYACCQASNTCALHEVRGIGHFANVVAVRLLSQLATTKLPDLYAKILLSDNQFFCPFNFSFVIFNFMFHLYRVVLVLCTKYKVNVNKVWIILRIFTQDVPDYH